MQIEFFHTWEHKVITSIIFVLINCRRFCGDGSCCMLYAECVSAEIKMKFNAQRNQTTVFERGWILCVGRGKKRTCCFSAALKGRQKVSHFRESTPCGPLSGTNEGTKCGGRVSKVYVFFSPNWAFVIKTCGNVKRWNIWEKTRYITGTLDVSYSEGRSEGSLYDDVIINGVWHLCFVSNNQIGRDNFKQFNSDSRQ